MFAALDEGHHVEWIELGALEPHLTPPFDDGHEILDALARLQMKRPCLTLENLTQAVAKVSHKSAICLVLTEYNEAVGKVTQQLRQRNRTVSLYLPESCGAMPSEAAIFRYGERYLKTTA